MNQAQTRIDLEALFRRTEEAHRRAFADRPGGDPDWPIWYAERLREPLEQVAGMPFVKSRLIYCLMNAHYEHEARAPDSDWAGYVADRFMECYAATESRDEEELALYYFPACPYCQRVLRVLDELGISVDLRDIHENSAYRNELLEARGRATVPVLRIGSVDGSQRWMPESHDIVDWLRRNYG